MDKKKIPFRGIVVGSSYKYGVQIINPPTDIEQCGLYVHVDDIPNWLLWEERHKDVKQLADLLEDSCGKDELK